MALNASLTGSDLMNIIMGYQRSQVLMTATSLGVFDAIHCHGGPTPLDTLAHRVAADPEALERLLNSCVSLGLLEKCIDANGVAEFDNTITGSKYLVGSSAMTMKPLIAQNHGMYNMWSRLETSVRQGGPIVGCPPSDNGMREETKSLWSNEEKLTQFMSCMTMFSRMDAPHILRAFDFSEFDTACDLGGGSGAMAMEFATWCPHMQVTMMDLPHVTKVASRVLPKARPKNLSLAAGDILKDDLPNVDLFIVSHVLHTMSEDNIRHLLQKVYQSLRPGGALLILERTLNENKDGPAKSLMFDLGFLLMTEGRERSEDEYRGLLDHSGFHDVCVKVMPDMCLRDAILARKE